MRDEWWVRQRHPVVDQVAELVAPLLESEGFELVDLEYQPRGRATLRVFVDVAGRVERDGLAAESGGVTLDQLTTLTRLVSDAIDVADPIPNPYNLEVSSPGLDRPLARRRDFEAAIGQHIQVRTSDKIDGRARFQGELTALEGASVLLRVEGDLQVIPVAAIAKARLEYAPAKPQGKRRRSRS